MDNITTVVAHLTNELRRAGLPVSISERADALRALRLVGFRRRADVHAALSLCLVKSADHQRVFDLAFELFFNALRPAPDAVAAGKEHLYSASLLGKVDRRGLSCLVTELLVTANPLMMRHVAAELVDRFAGLDPTRPVAGTSYVQKAMGGLDLDAIRTEATRELNVSHGAAKPTKLSQFTDRSELDSRIEVLRRTVESEIRSRLVASRGAAAVSQTTRLSITNSVVIGNADREQMRQVMAALEPLARKLSTALARKYNRWSHRSLDFRATMRASLASGGTPIEVRLRPRRPPKPNVVVLADISGSMASYAEFALRLVYSIRSQFSAVRCFAFRDGIADVTPLLDGHQSTRSLISLIAQEPDTTWLDGHSDYGHVLLSFWEKWGTSLTGRSIVIIVGDARSNYHLTNAHLLRLIRQRSRAVFWLNPERKAAWSSGDSVIGEYQPYCDVVAECRTIAQLRDFVIRLL